MIKFMRQSFDCNELVIDNFAGGGGASTGITEALGRPVDVAINHSAAAIAMHAANHPTTMHITTSILEVDPRTVCGSRKVGLAWFSPDCTHFSKAKGGQPRSKEIRGLADVVIDWARTVKPRVIVVENVEEFLTWGPLDADGHPIKERSGEDFERWFRALTGCGYAVDHRVLVAADYGTPTTRKRLVVVARRDGQPIVWPEATHGKGRPRPWRTAAEIIDWGLPCPSIFGRKKPLADATLRRIAAGLRRYVIESAQPFIVGVSHGDFARGAGSRVRGLDQPHATVTGSNDHALVTPFIAPLTHQGNPARVHSIAEPLRTVTAANRGELALIAPYIKSDYSASVGRDMRDPLATVTAGGGGHHSLVVPTLVQTGYGEREGQAPRVPGLDKPLGTVVAGGQKHALVAAFLAKHYTMPGGKPHAGIGCDGPLHTVTTADHHALVTAGLAPARDHTEEVRAFLVKYYGSSGRVESQKQTIDDPLATVPTRDRFGLVTVHGQEYVITDIGMRMLSPRELFNAQGFPEDYVIDLVFDGKPLTKTAQIELAGNSVCVQKAEAVVGANLFERWEMAG